MVEDDRMPRCVAMGCTSFILRAIGEDHYKCKICNTEFIWKRVCTWAITYDAKWENNKNDTRRPIQV